MSNILTKTENLGHCDNHSGLHPRYADFGFACVNWKLIPTAESPQSTEKDSDYGQGGKNQSSADSESVVTTPETIRISLPALRSVILAVVDDGCPQMAEREGRWHQPWRLWHPADVISNDARLRFVDETEERLRQLPARG